MPRSFFWEWKISNGLDVPIGKRLRFCRSSRSLSVASIEAFAGAICFLEPKTFCRIGQFRALKE